jgi:hypothetical protein
MNTFVIFRNGILPMSSLGGCNGCIFFDRCWLFCAHVYLDYAEYLILLGSLYVQLYYYYQQDGSECYKHVARRPSNSSCTLVLWLSGCSVPAGVLLAFNTDAQRGMTNTYARVQRQQKKSQHKCIHTRILNTHTHAHTTVAYLEGHTLNSLVKSSS